MNDTVITDLAKIRSIINLSKVPLDTSSKVYCGIYNIVSDHKSIPGPSDYYILSVFKVIKNDSLYLKQINTLTKPLEKKSFYYKDWLPEHVIKNIFTAEKFISKKVYSASPFYKSPFTEGFFILDEDFTLYLYLETK